MRNCLDVAICGATGRMGKELLPLCQENPNIKIVAACTRGSNPHIGEDISTLIGTRATGLKLTNSFAGSFATKSPNSKQVVIDFSSADALPDHASMSAKLGIPLLVCVTGVTNSQKEHLKSLAKDIPILIAPNTSIGANLLALIGGVAAQILSNADVEICETHHRYKKDSPSGAAMFIANHIASRRGVEFSDTVCFNRHEADVRKNGQIGVFGLRGGNQVGTHTVNVFDEDESLELTHRATNRRIFAAGALKAADFLVDQEPGIYNMFDVFNMDALLGEKI